MSKWRKARKKPVVVEFREVEPNTALWSPKRIRETIKTREGILCGYPDKDYIIKGVDGEIYPIKKEIFAKTYEVLEE